MVLGYFGVEKTEAELIELTGAKAGLGCEAPTTVAAAEKLGFEADYAERHPFLKTTILSSINQLTQSLCQRKDIVSLKKSKTRLLQKLNTRALASPMHCILTESSVLSAQTASQRLAHQTMY